MKNSLGFTSQIESIGTVTNGVTIVSVTTDVPVGLDKNGKLKTQTISAHGYSKRHGTDKFNAEVAIKLAYGRALSSLSKKLMKQGQGIVKSLDDNRNVSEAKVKKTKRQKKKMKELVASTAR